MPTTQHFPIRGAKVVARVPEILRLCAGKKILHLGCSDVPYTLQRGDQLLHKQLAQVTPASQLWGLDASAEGVGLLRSMGFAHIIHGNVQQLDTTLQHERFDVILAGEILEHLVNPGQFLNGVMAVCSPDTELIITTPNAFAFKGFLHSLLWREKVHEDHTSYFSYIVLRQLLEKCGFHCRELYYYQEIEGVGLTRVFEQSLAFVTRLSPVLADGVFVRATI